MDHLLTWFAGDQWKQFVYNLNAEKALSPLLLLLPNGSLLSTSHYMFYGYICIFIVPIQCICAVEIDL